MGPKNTSPSNENSFEQNDENSSSKDDVEQKINGYMKYGDDVEVFGPGTQMNTDTTQEDTCQPDKSFEEHRILHISNSQKCGCAGCTPKCLQRFAVPMSYLICVSCVVFMQSCVVSGYSSGILTTIEKRYSLWTRELGYIISSYDTVTMICGVIISYTGARFNRANLVGKGAFVIAIGSVLFTLPHFFGDTYTYNFSLDQSSHNSTENSNVCNRTSLHSDDSCAEAAKNPERWALYIFMVAFMIVGVGASPIYSIGATYLYDNVSTSKFPVYSSIMYSFGALGPAVGFLLAAVFTQMWVHPESAPPPGLTAGSTGWIGAWWMGFFLLAFIALLVGSALVLFPRSLPNIDHTKDVEDTPTFAGFGKHIKDFPKVLVRLLCNPTWLFISLVMVVEQSIGTLFNRYVGKLFQSVFNMTVFYASILMGAVLIPAAVMGIIAGGVIMKKLNLSIAGICKFLLFCSFVPVIAISIMIALDCDGVKFAGVNEPYSAYSVNLPEHWQKNLTSACNSQCFCQEALYDPVCGSDGIMYFSPCHAGCAVVSYTTDAEGEIKKNFTECSCIQDTPLQAAAPGRCDAGCASIIPVMVVLFIVVFCTTLGQNPVLLVTLRCVEPNTRSFALGLQNLLIQLLAYIPAPIYFGQIFDSTCMLWSTTCEGDGACLEYETKKLPLYLYGTCLGFKGITIVFLLLAYIAAKRQKKSSYDVSKVPGEVDGNMATTDS